MSVKSSVLADKTQKLIREPTVVIEPSRGWLNLQLSALWDYRELVYFLVWRDLKVRYKQSVLGVSWIIIQPVVTMIVFTLVFNRFLGIGADSEIPYPIFTYVALLPWTYFAGSLNRGAIALVGNRGLISKIYFPRLVIPTANVLPGLVDFAIAFVVLLGMMAYYNFALTAQMLLLPLALLLAVVTALGVGLWLSALNVQYRDIQYVTPFLIQIWMYATPIIYPITSVPEQWRWLYSLNPMVSVVQGFRWALLSDASFDGINWASVVIALIILISGLIYFRRSERVFADVV
jgi:lipopolysaccharide transport system permease protein